MQLLNFSLENIIYLIFFSLILIFFGYKIFFSYFSDDKIKWKNYFFSHKTASINFILWFLLFSLLILSIFGINLDFYRNSQSIWNDITFVIDSSKSMDVADISFEWQTISRLEMAKKLVSNYISKNQDNNYSIIIFAWDTQLLVPQTSDTDYILTMLNGIKTNSIKKWWTNFIDVINLATSNLSQNDFKNIVILSDWWDENIDLKKIVKSSNFKIFGIWIWTYEWWYIPSGVDFWWNISYKLYKWEKILSKLNSQNLQNITDKTLWKYTYYSWIDSINKLSKYFINSAEKISKTTKNDWTYLLIVFAFIIAIIIYFNSPYKKI